MKKTLLIDLAIILVIALMSAYGGYSYRQMEVLDNAQEVLKQKKTSFEIQDLEIIIFDEVQL